MAGPARRRRDSTPALLRIQIRVRPAEYDAIAAAAARPGRGVTLARFVADAALAAADATPPSPVRRRTPSRLVLAEIVIATAEVARVGNNLNQLAREKNITGHMPAGTADEVQRALTALRRLADITEAAGGSQPKAAP